LVDTKWRSETVTGVENKPQRMRLVVRGEMPIEARS